MKTTPEQYEDLLQSPQWTVLPQTPSLQRRRISNNEIKLIFTLFSFVLRKTSHLLIEEWKTIYWFTNSKIILRIINK